MNISHVKQHSNTVKALQKKSYTFETLNYLSESKI